MIKYILIPLYLKSSNNKPKGLQRESQKKNNHKAIEQK
jgi:hypothetical protein